jgi:fatty-acid desaturase
MIEAVNVATREADVPWDGRPSGFRRILPGPVAVLGFWTLASVLLVQLAARLPGHTPERGFGYSGWVLGLYLFLMAQIVFTGVGFIYHRVLTHRACRLHPLVKYSLLIASLPAGTPIQWVGNHRHHHGRTDRAQDWHSPIHGFWAAHAGWYIYTRNSLVCALYTCAGPLRMLFDAFWRPQTNQEYAKQAKDVAAEPFLAFVSRPSPFAFFVIGQVAVSWGFTYLMWGTRGFLPLFLTQVIYYLVGDGVNSVLHMWGDKPFTTRDDSRNFPVLGFMLLGEGYHNAHHAFPRSLKVGVLPGQFDTIYELARVLRRIGLCRDIVEIGPREILGKLQDEKHRAYFERQLPESKLL